MGVNFRGIFLSVVLSFLLLSPSAFAKPKKSKKPRKPASEAVQTKVDEEDAADSEKPTPAATQAEMEVKKRSDDLERMRKQMIIPEVKLTADQKKLLADLEKLLAKSKTKEHPWTVPSSSIQTPVGFGAQWTDVFVAAGGQYPNAYTSKPNGSMYLGFGLGNAQKYVGLEVALGSYGIWPPFDPGGVSLKVHHLFNNGWAVAVGWNNAIYWGNPDQGVSFYGVVSKYFVLNADQSKPFSLVTFHVGTGNGEYRSIPDVLADKQSIGIFASAGARIFEPLSVIVNWTGSNLATGISVAPFRRFPIVAAASLMGWTHPGGQQLRGVFSLAYSDSVLADTFPINIFK